MNLCINIKFVSILILMVCFSYKQGNSVILTNHNMISKASNEKICRELELMNFFLNRYDDRIKINDNLKMTKGDYKIIREFYPLYYRFLSILSGMDTQFNQRLSFAPDTCICRSNKNMNLVSWYAEHQEDVTSDMFMEYFQLELELDSINRILIHSNDYKNNAVIIPERYRDVFKKLEEFTEKYKF